MLLFEGKKKPHIKKPLNAFMLYMKEMRPKVTMIMIMTIIKMMTIIMMMTIIIIMIMVVMMIMIMVMKVSFMLFMKEMRPKGCGRDNYDGVEDCDDGNKDCGLNENPGIPGLFGTGQTDKGLILWQAARACGCSVLLATW